MAAMTNDDGLQRLLKAQQLLRYHRTDPTAASDDDLRSLRSDARAAIDRLDDDPAFELAHETLDDVGEHVRLNRPHLCDLERNDDGFVRNCPVDLGHIRLGLSVGLEIKESHCSVCEQDLWKCPHIPGTLYNGQPAVRVITKARFFEVSVVKRPDFPDARFMSTSYSQKKVEALLGRSVPDNARLTCDRCLAKCPGIREYP